MGKEQHCKLVKEINFEKEIKSTEEYRCGLQGRLCGLCDVLLNCLMVKCLIRIEYGIHIMDAGCGKDCVGFVVRH